MFSLCRPNGQPCFDTKEFDLVRNMMQAVDEERYDEAGKLSLSHPPYLVVILVLINY